MRHSRRRSFFSAKPKTHNDGPLAVAAGKVLPIQRAARPVAGTTMIERLEDRRLLTAIISPEFGTQNFQTLDGINNHNNPEIVLIFWGSWWGGAFSPLANQIANETSLVINSGYFSGTAEYVGAGNDNVSIATDPGTGAIQRAWIHAGDGFGDYEPFDNFSVGSPINNITTQGSDLGNVINSAINNGLVDDISGAIYEVVTPPNITESGFNGYNTLCWDPDFPSHWHYNNATWVEPSYTSSSTINNDAYTVRFGHETAESITGGELDLNPPGASQLGGEYEGPGQICDNEAEYYTLREPDGALVQSMWSDADQAYIIPDGNSVNFYYSPIWDGSTFPGRYNLTLQGLGVPGLLPYNNTFSLNYNPDATTDAYTITEDGQTENWDIDSYVFQYANPNPLASITVETGSSGNDTVNVYGNAPTCNLTINNNSISGSDTINIGAGSIAQVQGNIAIQDPSTTATVTINIDDANDASVQDFYIYGTEVETQFADLTVTYSNAASTTLNITAGLASDNLFVYSTSVPTTLQSGGGQDNVSVGNYTLSGIAAPLTILNTPYYDVVNIEDTSDTGNRTIDLGILASGTGYISGIAPALIYFGDDDISQLNLDTGSGQNVINVTNTPNSGSTYINTGSSNNSVNVTGTTDPLYIDGGSGDVFANVGGLPGASGSLAGISGAVDVYSSAGAAYLTINDSADTTARTATINLGSITWTDYAAAIDWTASSRSTGGVVYISINGGSGGDVFNVLNIDALYYQYYLIGGGGTDTLNFEGYSTGGNTFTVNATQVVMNGEAIEYSNFQFLNAVCGGGNNSLTQTAQPGDNALLTYANGTGNDSLTVTGGNFPMSSSPTGSLSVSVGGGSGAASVTFTGDISLASLSVLSNGTVAVTSAFISVNSVTQSGGTVSIGTAGLTVDASIGTTSGINTVQYTLTGGNLSCTGDEIIGSSTNGTFNQTGGTNTVTASNPNSPNFFLADNPGSTGNYLLSGSSSLLQVTGRERIGQAGAGHFDQSGGTNALTGNLDLASQSGTTGTYFLSGAASILNVSGQNAGIEYVGDAGTGVLNQTGGTNTLGTLVLGNNSGATGTDTVSGGSQTVGGAAYVGGNASGAAGKGNLTTTPAGGLTVTGSLVIYPTGTVNFDDPTVGDLILNKGGVVNVNNALLINYGAAGVADPIKTIQSELAIGYNSGAWNGSGIISSNAQSTGSIYTLGYADAADPGNPADLPSGTIKIMYTYYGDANLDGKVDASDYSRIDNGYLNHLSGWDNGDFNYDGVINGSDYTLIDNAYNRQGASLAAEMAAIAAPSAQDVMAASAAIISGSASRGSAANPLAKAATQIKPVFVPASTFQTTSPITTAESASGDVESLLLRKDVLDRLSQSSELVSQ